MNIVILVKEIKVALAVNENKEGFVSAIDEWTTQKKANHQGRGTPYALQLNMPQRSNQKPKKRK